ncbi:MAG TPA: Pvc16 family protein [Pyrinomonadaceae bacterium]
MALADSAKAIGAVTNSLVKRLHTRTGLNVMAGRPEMGAGNGQQLNVFLYETSYDPFLKNHALDEGQKTPLWLVLKYLLTPFDDFGDSDTPQAHETLGAGLHALHQADLLEVGSLEPNDAKALSDNPEELQITFDEAPVDLLSKLMQGSDESYRLSAAFQVRPVMIASSEPPAYSLLVGIDYTKAPPMPTGGGAVVDVIPSMGASLTEISPTGFELDEEVTIYGTDLHLSGLSVKLGAMELPVTMQQPDQLKFKVDSAIVNGSNISAGSLPISLIQTLPSGRRKSSNLLIGNLVPTLTSSTVVLPTSVAPPPPGPPPVPPPPKMIFATIDLTGKLLGAADDDVYLALYRDGRVVKMFDVFTLPASPTQTQKQLVMTVDAAVPEGRYLTILKVNGQQAVQSFPVDLVP